jgi:hypothetical protein
MLACEVFHESTDKTLREYITLNVRCKYCYEMINLVVILFTIDRSFRSTWNQDTNLIGLRAKTNQGGWKRDVTLFSSRRYPLRGHIFLNPKNVKFPFSLPKNDFFQFYQLTLTSEKPTSNLIHLIKIYSIYLFRKSSTDTCLVRPRWSAQLYLRDIHIW